ncbi:MAG: hypothetical protein J3K34DRAFT_397716 [Monoraphidium minutum]|nr:MAG: hypothetical protein J3K34DRAFT_397716 [Monoraphidium minutum]
MAVDREAQKSVELSRAQQDVVLAEKAKAALAAEKEDLTSKVVALRSSQFTNESATTSAKAAADAAAEALAAAEARAAAAEAAAEKQAKVVAEARRDAEAAAAAAAKEAAEAAAALAAARAQIDGAVQARLAAEASLAASLQDNAALASEVGDLTARLDGATASEAALRELREVVRKEAEASAALLAKAEAVAAAAAEQQAAAAAAAAKAEAERAAAAGAREEAAALQAAAKAAEAAAAAAEAAAAARGEAAAAAEARASAGGAADATAAAALRDARAEAEAAAGRERALVEALAAAEARAAAAGAEAEAGRAALASLETGLMAQLAAAAAEAGTAAERGRDARLAALTARVQALEAENASLKLALAKREQVLAQSRQFIEASLQRWAAPEPEGAGGGGGGGGGGGEAGRVAVAAVAVARAQAQANGAAAAGGGGGAVAPLPTRGALALAALALLLACGAPPAAAAVPGAVDDYYFFVAPENADNNRRCNGTTFDDFDTTDPEACAFSCGTAAVKRVAFAPWFVIVDAGDAKKCQCYRGSECTGINDEMGSFMIRGLPCTVCKSDQRQTADCSIAADRTCAQCKVCAPDEFVAAACTEGADNTCQKCKKCASDEVEDTPCTKDTDRTCKKRVPGDVSDIWFEYRDADANKWCEGTAFHPPFETENLQECADTCLSKATQMSVAAPWAFAIDVFEKKCGCFPGAQCETPVGDPVSAIYRAEQCTVCKSDERQKEDCTYDADRTCDPCKVCAPDEFVAAACTEGADNTCQKCKECASDEVEDTPCTKDTDRTCKKTGAVPGDTNDIFFQLLDADANLRCEGTAFGTYVTNDGQACAGSCLAKAAEEGVIAPWRIAFDAGESKCGCFEGDDCTTPIVRVTKCSVCGANEVEVSTCTYAADRVCNGVLVLRRQRALPRPRLLDHFRGRARPQRPHHAHGRPRLTALGFRFAGDLTVEVELATDMEYAVRPDGRGPGTGKAVLPTTWAGVFAGVRVNGEDAAAKVGSGETLRFGDASVHFPAARHAADATDGPVLVLTTPGLQITCYLESEDVTHLDFAVTLVSGAAASGPMHGLLGQSLGWAAGAPAAIEGEEMDYVIDAGLLGTDFPFSAFTGKRAPAPAPRRALPAPAAPAVGASGKKARA